MNEYEISYIVDPSITEEARSEADRAVDGAIEGAKGSIVSNTESTRRRLAYPVNKQHLGFLRTVQAAMDPAAVSEIRDELQKNNSIIRLSILHTPARESVTTAIFEATAKKQQVEPKKATTAKKPVKEISAKELDEKIEEALDEEVK